MAVFCLRVGCGSESAASPQDIGTWGPTHRGNASIPDRRDPEVDDHRGKARKHFEGTIMADVETVSAINTAAVGRASSAASSGLAAASSTCLSPPVSGLVLSVAIAARVAHAFTTGSR